MKAIGHWIGGREMPGTSGRTAHVFDPATGRPVAEVHLASCDEVDAVAKIAAQEWRRTSLARRTDVLFRLRELLVAGRDELARIVAHENGKVVSDAMGEVSRGIENVEYACGIAPLVRGGYTEQASTGVDVYSDPATDRGRCRNHAIQLSRHGADRSLARRAILQRGPRIPTELVTAQR